jgi:hypothetical protein
MSSGILKKYVIVFLQTIQDKVGINRCWKASSPEHSVQSSKKRKEQMHQNFKYYCADNRPGKIKWETIFAP